MSGCSKEAVDRGGPAIVLGSCIADGCALSPSLAQPRCGLARREILPMRAGLPRAPPCGPDRIDTGHNQSPASRDLLTRLDEAHRRIGTKACVTRLAPDSEAKNPTLRASAGRDCRRQLPQKLR